MSLIRSLMKHYLENNEGAPPPSEELVRLLIRELEGSLVQEKNNNNKIPIKREKQKNRRLKASVNSKAEARTVRWRDKTLEVTWLNFSQTILNLTLSDGRYVFAGQQRSGKPTQRAFVAKYRWCYSASCTVDLSRLSMWLQDGHETPAIHQMLSRLQQFLVAIESHTAIE